MHPAGPLTPSGLQDLTAAGHRLEYRTVPARQAGRPPLVFLHEGLGSAGLWRDFPDRVAECTGCGALIYSRYGFGGSDPFTPPHGPDFEVEALEALPQVRERLGITGPVLVGHSDGATIALVHAAAGRWPVRGLVLLAPHVFVEEETLAGIRQAREAFQSGSLRRSLQPWHTDVDATFAGWLDLWLEPAFRQWSIVDRLPAITCPVLLVQGEQDQYGTPAQVEEIARRVSGPAALRVLPQCGHAPHIERREEVLDAIAEFVAGL